MKLLDKINKGLKQWCLFCSLEGAIKRGKLTVDRWDRIITLNFADDDVLVAQSTYDLEFMLKKFQNSTTIGD